MSGPVALITGSSRGAGAAIARALHNAGFRAVINYLQSQHAAEQLAEELEAVAIQADVTRRDDVQRLFADAERHYGAPISVVVNNALGHFEFNGDQRKRLEDIEWSDFDSQMRTTLQGALHTVQAAIPGWKKLGTGRVINIGSNLVQNPVVPYQDYTAAKGALLAFTRTTAAELGPMGVTCNMVAGGLLKMTDASRSTPLAVWEQVTAVTPMRRAATPEDLAGAVKYFAGADASCVTGQQIIVDGGLCMA